ncbi:M14 family metallopeptidase [Aestuariibacter halophilus]|uniref:M14 family metallopeptidase n=1 Tax=Fluctibacter halophilus TaxID=226011 RepID=A0ABS8G328_9ALTE|nr:M14 family metallopeptidase [Aestuariibacter halophilus]MCC2614938.1 M14 family metallopeptidase [Aestuariibacter halophilus]
MGRFSLACVLLLFATSVSAQQYRYTDTESGAGLIPLGYPVPQPVDSLTPVDGFRTYESLNSRHQQLVGQSPWFSATAVGTTLKGQTIWAYQIGTSDTTNALGGPVGSALINGGIHAREWQSPEATTGYMEALFEHQNDQHLHQYLLENLHLVIIPVLNIDGFVQTQRYPSQVTSSVGTPREGRMRRKNLRDTDTDIETLDDNLNGVDLNRNNDPYWATNDQRSSSVQTSLVYHGSVAASEPETQALQQGAVVAGEQRLRFYTDTHSFSQIYYTPLIGQTRRDRIAARVATVMRAANANKYRYGPSAAGSGIGATDEYFANTYAVPSYTLEIEPLSSASEYGGFGISHDGFILPASEVARMRRETTAATLIGLYTMADIPYVQEIQLLDTDQQVVWQQHWQADGQQRTLQRTVQGSLNAGQSYQLRVIFNKPMRSLDEGGEVVGNGLSTLPGITLSWQAVMDGEAQTWSIDAAQGQWITDVGSVRYRTDTFVVPVTLPETFELSSVTRLTMAVSTTDMAGQGLDTNPATIVDWQQGRWLNYEDSDGNTDTDTGGEDVAMRLIDDGSPLYEDTSTPTTPVVPTPPSTSSSSGGVFSVWWGFLSLLVVIRRQSR